MEGGKISSSAPKSNIKCGTGRSCIFHTTAHPSPRVLGTDDSQIAFAFQMRSSLIPFCLSFSEKARKEAWLLPWASGRSVPGHQLFLAWASGRGGCGSPTGKAPGEEMRVRAGRNWGVILPIARLQILTGQFGAVTLVSLS